MREIEMDRHQGTEGRNERERETERQRERQRDTIRGGSGL